MSTLQEKLSGRRLLVVYLVLSVLMVGGFWNARQLTQEVERSAEARVRIACQAVNDANGVLREVVLDDSVTSAQSKQAAIEILDNAVRDCAGRDEPVTR